MTRVLVTGSRDWQSPQHVVRIVDRLVARYGTEVTVIQGEARGVDSMFRDAARAAGLAVESFPADWDNHGRGAGHRRNQDMVNSGANFAIAVSDHIETSRGTRDCVSRCLKAGIPVYLFDGNETRKLKELP